MNKQNCHNCKNAYPNYLEYDQGPCPIFEEMPEDEDWETLDVFKTGCKYWKPKHRDI